RSPWQEVNLKNFPSKEKLEYCIDLYFGHFHQASLLSIVVGDCSHTLQVWPLIHQPSFDPDQDPTVTLAVASIGALYSPWSAAKTFSNTMSEINRRLLLFLVSEPDTQRMDSTVTNSQQRQAEYDCRYTRAE